MSILVVCPGCHKRFKVSDQFAGKSGKCPNCKHAIEVPTKETEVKVHAPTAFAEGGRTTTGKLITKPIARTDTKLQPVATVAIVAAAGMVLLIAWAAGGVIRSHAAIRSLTLLLVSPPLVVTGYSFLRNDDLEPYRGKALYLRSTICAVAYAALWGVFGHFLAGSVLTGELWQWAFVTPPLLAAGALIALACLDLDFVSGFFHYAFYLLVTAVLGWLAGMGWPWNLAETPLS